MLSLPDFWDPLNFLLLTVVMFLVVAGRYFLIAGIFHFVFYVVGKKKWAHRRLGKTTHSRQFYKEVKWSLITSIIFALAGALTTVLWQKGYTKLYVDVHDYPLWLLPVSLIVSMLIHESYYYWLHRWMHKPQVFKILHKVHHDSNTTSPWTAFSFHPLEGVSQALILPLTILVIPMHMYVLLVQLTLMTFSSVINHLEIEVYPANFHKNRVGKWLIGATHHSLHHKQFRFNYGLYFTFWDKWKKTESPKYGSLFEEKTASGGATQTEWRQKEEADRRSAT
jgi:sterol desaturase/sphingolipid hydroxylase (fatty acid hydroxylase superfamily)